MSKKGARSPGRRRHGGRSRRRFRLAADARRRLTGPGRAASACLWIVGISQGRRGAGWRQSLHRWPRSGIGESVLRPGSVRRSHPGTAPHRGAEVRLQAGQSGGGDRRRADPSAPSSARARSNRIGLVQWKRERQPDRGHPAGRGVLRRSDALTVRASCAWVRIA